MKEKYDWFNEDDLINIIKEKGIENIIIIAPLRPIHYTPFIGGIAFTTSTDEPKPVRCKIGTERYDPFEKYKIELLPVVDSYPKECYYTMDLASHIRSGICSIEIYDEKEGDYTKLNIDTSNP